MKRWPFPGYTDPGAKGAAADAAVSGEGFACPQGVSKQQAEPWVG